MKIGILELLSYTVTSEWGAYVPIWNLRRQFYSVMPQVISVWCRELGHEVTYRTYFGQDDPMSLLPTDLDVVFIATSTQACALAYAMAKLYRMRHVKTVLGGPHAKSFSEDSARFFDVVVKECDKELLKEILDGHIGKTTVVTAAKRPTEFPTVEERMPEIVGSAFAFHKPDVTSVVSLFASTGCPYDCDFCTDWDTPYHPISPERLERELDYVSTHLPGTILGFQDANFGVRFDQTIAVLEKRPPESRNPYMIQCSLSLLRKERMPHLKRTNCYYIAPGIESWVEYGSKAGVGDLRGREKLDSIVQHFKDLHEYVPGLQANFIFGFDTDEGTTPFELTAEFMRRVPFAWPNVNILTPYGGTPLFDRYQREGRLLDALPLMFYCSPYVAYRPLKYDALSFYGKLIQLYEEMLSARMVMRRTVSEGRFVIQLARVLQTWASHNELVELRRIRDRLESDADLRAFHEGSSDELPELYHQQFERRLGRFAELLSREERIPQLPPSP
jgi:radical SAM superfamily enzyme YgiQ (UPF0313 family)